MADTNDMLTSAKIAEQLSVSPAKVKKAIQELNIEPDMKKGVCAYYGKAAFAKIQKAVK
jgi:Mn-dependent DtxR family transcriptional regulator